MWGTAGRMTAVKRRRRHCRNALETAEGPPGDAGCCAWCRHTLTSAWGTGSKASEALRAKECGLGWAADLLTGDAKTADNLLEVEESASAMGQLGGGWGRDSPGGAACTICGCSCQRRFSLAHLVSRASGVFQVKNWMLLSGEQERSQLRRRVRSYRPAISNIWG